MVFGVPKIVHCKIAVPILIPLALLHQSSTPYNPSKDAYFNVVVINERNISALPVSEDCSLIILRVNRPATEGLRCAVRIPAVPKPTLCAVLKAIFAGLIQHHKRPPT